MLEREGTGRIEWRVKKERNLRKRGWSIVEYKSLRWRDLAIVVIHHGGSLPLTNLVSTIDNSAPGEVA